MAGFLLLKADPSYQPEPFALQQLKTKTRGVVDGPGIRYLGAVAPECDVTGLARKIRFPGDGCYMAVSQVNKGDRCAWTVQGGKARRCTADEAKEAGFFDIPADRLKPGSAGGGEG